MKEQILQDWKIRIGRNKEENDQLLTDAKSTDWWFHLESESSPHVILTPLLDDLPIKPPKKQITQSALMVKQHSKLKAVRKTGVIYTPVNNIAKTPYLGTVKIINPTKIKIVFV